MNRALLWKCFRESRWLLLSCTAAVYAFCWVRVWMVGRIDTERFGAILDLLPGDWKKFTASEPRAIAQIDMPNTTTGSSNAIAIRPA